MTIVAIDVAYEAKEAVAAGVEFAGWADGAALAEHCVRISDVAPYEPGQFYRRELPCILAVLKCLQRPAEVVVVDGYVWLEGETTPGLGAHLYESLGRKVAVVGVAKTEFAGAGGVRVYRGKSVRPLIVTAAGMDVQEAAECVRRMHGEHRIPTLLKRVDRLGREGT